MIFITDENLIIRTLRLRRTNPVGEYVFFLHYGMGNQYYSIPVEDTGDENVMEFIIPSSFTSTMSSGEYAYSIVADSQVVTSGMARKREVNFPADTVYTGTVESGNRYTVLISAPVGGFLYVDGERYQTYRESVPEGREILVQAVPDEHHTFNQWSDGETENPRTVVVNNDITLAASFEAAEYTVSISAGSNGSVSVNGVVGDYTATLAYGTVLTILGLPNTGYTFTQWSDGNTDNPRTIIVTGPVTLASAYQVATQFYQVTVTAGQNGTVSVNGVAGDYSQTVIEGAVLTLEAVPNAGYDFDSWSDGNTSNPRTLVVNSAISLTSAYEAQTQHFSVNVSAGSNGTVLVNGVVGDYSQSVAEGTVLTILGIPNTGYNFTQWSDGSSSASRTLTVTSDITLSASFAIQTFSVSISAGQNGSVSVNGTPGNYSQTVNYGTALTLEATANQDYNFTAWSDGVSTNPRILIVNADIILIASFQAQTQLAIKHTPGVTINAPTITGLNVMESVDADGWLKVTYDGDIVTYDSTSLQGNADVLEVVLPDTCTAIGPNAFSGCSGLAKVSVSENCTSIGSSAFANTGLTEFSAKGVTSFGSGAFSNCARLESVEFGENLATLGEGLFNNCSILNYVGFDGINGPTIANNDLGSGIHATGTMYIPMYANYASYADFIAAMPSGWTVLRRKQNQILYQTTDDQKLNDVPVSLGGASLTRHTYANGWGVIEYGSDTINYIDGNSFMGYNTLSYVSIPTLEQGIEDSAFSGCTALTTVEIEGCKYIDVNAFHDCPIANGPDTGKLTLPPGTEYILEHSFDSLVSSVIEFGPSLYRIDAGTFNLQNATELYVYTAHTMDDRGNPFMNTPATGTLHMVDAADVPYWTRYLPGWTVVYDLGRKMLYTTTDGNVLAPYNVNAFSPATIVSNTYSDGQGVIEFDRDIVTIGEQAFWGCTTLETITLPRTVTVFDGGAQFSKCTSLSSVTLPYGLTNIAHGSFYQCTSLASIEIPNTVTEIDVEAFEECTSLTSVTIPGSVKKIKDFAFHQCTNLSSVTLCDGLETIFNNAFNSSGLVSIYIPKTTTTIGGTGGLGGSPFHNCIRVASIKVDPTNPVYDSRDNCNAIIRTYTYPRYDDIILVQGCKNTVIPNSVTTIGGAAFERVEGLTSIVIPDSVTSFGAAAFLGCTNLTSIYFESTTNVPSFIGTPSYTFLNVPASGTVYGQPNVDYSTIMAALPSGWTLVQ